MIPVQYFIAFDEACKNLNSAKDNFILRVQSSNKLLESAHEIIFKGYAAELKKIFTKGESDPLQEARAMYTTWNELLDTNMEALRIAEMYHSRYAEILSSIAQTFEGSGGAEEISKDKALLETITGIFKNDEFLNTALEGSELIAKATVAPFAVMVNIVKSYNKDSFLLKEEAPQFLN